VCVGRLVERVWWNCGRKKCADGKKLKSKSWRNGEEESKWEGVKSANEGAERPGENAKGPEKMRI